MQKVILETHRDLNVPGLLRRRIDVWLPEQYHQNPEHRFPVLYMQDGQMVFDRFQKGDGWNVHHMISTLADAGKVTAPIVVAIPSTTSRRFEYLPTKAIDYPGGLQAYQ